MTDENRLAFERDLAVRQAKLCEADLKVIRLALNEARPLEALRQVNEAIERLDDELDAIEDLEGGLNVQEDAADGHADADSEAVPDTDPTSMYLDETTSTDEADHDMMDAATEAEQEFQERVDQDGYTDAMTEDLPQDQAANGGLDVADSVDDAASDSDLTEREQEVVDYVVKAGETTASEIVEDYGSESAQKALGDLADRGVLERRKDPEDGRRYLYSLLDGDDDSDAGEDGAGEVDERDGDAADATDPFADLDCDPDAVADALAGAESLRAFASALDVDRDTATTVAGRLGVLDKLAAGGSGVDPDEAAQLVQEVGA